jgi:ribosomal protein S18 acetylase RimI-like enzyme
MNYIIRPANKADTVFLWQMLYYAAHMDEQGAPPESARGDPDLAGYVEDWGERPGDAGFIAIAEDGRPIGAAWIRILADSPLYRVVARGTPELAIAVLPEHIGGGAGTLLLRHLLGAVSGAHRALVLSVRATNPARRLYERAGFVTVATITNRVGSASYVMQTELP